MTVANNGCCVLSHRLQLLGIKPLGACLFKHGTMTHSTNQMYNKCSSMVSLFHLPSEKAD